MGADFQQDTEISHLEKMTKKYKFTLPREGSKWRCIALTVDGWEFQTRAADLGKLADTKR